MSASCQKPLKRLVLPGQTLDALEPDVDGDAVVRPCRHCMCTAFFGGTLGQANCSSCSRRVDVEVTIGKTSVIGERGPRNRYPTAFGLSIPAEAES